MTFLNNIITDLLAQTSDLSDFALVLPGKRPAVFIKKILVEKKYSGFLPDFFTIEELVKDISEKQETKGIALWLFAYQVYSDMYGDEDFATFLKWFPTVQKDWDDMLKFYGDDVAVLKYMLDEERIKNWGAQLGDEDSARLRNLNFWRKMNAYFPILKQNLLDKNWATPGLIHTEARKNLEKFVQKTDKNWVFCGFNAFTPVEEALVRSLLQLDKGRCYFQADDYYMNDERQEAGKFLREHKKWKEFNDSRTFKWIENQFGQQKKIKVFEVSGNISQTKILPVIFGEIEDEHLADTAVVLLDENLLPASLDALSAQKALNITMGFPLKNLAFSNAVKKLFYIQKQQEKKSGSYYYNDVLSVLESLPNKSADNKVISAFKQTIQERNMVYLSQKKLRELLGQLSYIDLFERPASVNDYLDLLLVFCQKLKFQELDDIQYENVSHFEKSFKIIKNQISDYTFEITIETLENMIHHVVGTETIDFQGEPLQGLQIMGLLETRLLNFKNIILLSVNEGKLPLGNSQNSYLPFDVRRQFKMHTFLENDSIYAYHFYRFLQGAENIYLLYNALSSGVNTGEKSRFITQIEMESPHEIEEIVIENTSEPIESGVMEIQKTPTVMDRLKEWKSRVSASHLTAYLYDPIQFYFNNVLKARESDEIEEELSQRNYGNIVHYSLEYLYGKILNKSLLESDLKDLIAQTDEAIDFSINKLNHQPEFYSSGMNFVHKSIAKKVVQSILNYDLDLIQTGHTLEILNIEKQIDGIAFPLEEGDSVTFFGYIDRIDRVDGQLRVIDYKTGKAKKLVLKFDGKEETLLMQDDYKQAIQLCIYLYYMRRNFGDAENVSAGIWSFAEVARGVQILDFGDGDLDTAMISIKNLIMEILNPKIPFTESTKTSYSF